MFSPHGRARVAALVAVAALASLPAGAAGQNGAGDDQYTDPFGETSPSQSTVTTIKPVPTPPSTPSAPRRAPQPAPAPVQPVAEAAAVSAKPQLADTGLDVRAALLIGVALMAGGAALRLRLR